MSQGSNAAPAASAERYTTDIAYPSAFVFGQTPVQMQWAAVAAGKPPGPLTRPFTYCDLGCGDGMTLNVLAAEYPQATFIGIDLSTSQLAAARDLAARAELTNVSYIESGFTELARRQLPDMDYIAVHGTYSWIDDASRDAIHAFARDRLKPGGLFCVQYSTLPGSTVRDPVFTYLRELAAGADGDSGARFGTALRQLQRIGPHSVFFKVNPLAGEMLNRLPGEPVGRIAHDVLNRGPHSLYVREAHEPIAALGLEFVGSGNLKRNHPELMLTPAAYTVFRELTATADPLRHETLLDLLLSTETRCDVFRKPDPAADGKAGSDGIAGLGDLYIKRAFAGSDPESRRRVSEACAADLTAPICSDVLDKVAEATTIADVLAELSLAGYERRAVQTAIAQLFMTRCLNLLITPTRPDAFDSSRRYRLASPLNRILLDEKITVPDAIAFASPVLGSALVIPPDARLRLAALLGGDLDAIWAAFAAAGRRLLDARGQPLDSAAQFRAGIEAAVPEFAESAVPELLRLGLLEVDGDG